MGKGPRRYEWLGVQVDETVIGRRVVRDVLPPDMYSFSVLRKGLGRRTYDETVDMRRQYWLSHDDEHQRVLWARRHAVPHGFESLSELFGDRETDISVQDVLSAEWFAQQAR